MIADKLENLKNYAAVIPHCDAIIHYLNSNDLPTFDVGRYDIVDDAVFVLIQEYSTKPETEVQWESHIKYADIQIVLRGQEFIGYAPSGSFVESGEYNDERDIIFYDNDEKAHTSIFLSAGECAVFFPGEAHKPGVRIAQGSAVKKAVVKIAW